MKILLLGRTGQLGWELHRTMATFGEIIALDYPEVDLSRIKELIKKVSSIKPDLIINAAAYTDVDKAESEKEKAFQVNGDAPTELNAYAQKNRIPFIHYSTDYVFDGEKGTPYTEEDIPNPINVYGASKLAGEQGIQQTGGKYLIFRTSWVYSNRRGGFVNKILEMAKTQKTLRIVTDQVGSPTWARMLAEATARVVDRVEDQWGLYHLAGAGWCSRYEWAREIVRCANPSPNVSILSAVSAEFPTPARRPIFSGLLCGLVSSVFGLALPEWELSLSFLLGE